jgi:hypothetical protein
MFTPSERPARLVSGEGGNNGAAGSPRSPTLTHYTGGDHRDQIMS